MTTITIVTLQPLPAPEFAAKLQALADIAESLFGAVDVDFIATPTAATYQAAMAEFDELLAEVKAQPIVRMTPAQLAEIENERVGAEYSERPWEW